MSKLKFTDLDKATACYLAHQGVLKTLVPGQLWEVTYYDEDDAEAHADWLGDQMREEGR